MSTTLKSRTSADFAATRLDYDETHALVAQHVGEHVRVTYPNGWQRSGLVGLRKIGIHDVLTFDESIVGSEMGGAIRVEVKQANGRYA